MTFLYTRNHSYHGAAPKQHPDQGMINLWNHVADKANWRIVQLPNGFFQTEYKDLEDDDLWIDVTRRETLDGAEAAIDGSIEHYTKKLEFLKGPKVVKTFE
jgi:hypothetical protein